MELDYLPIDVDNIKYRPDRFAINLSGTILIFRISWNPVAEAFYFDLFDREGVAIVHGRRIVYGSDMLDVPDERLPDVSIIPADVSGDADNEGLTFDNFMKDVKCYIFEGDD